MRVYIKKLLTYWEVKKQQKEEIDLFLKTYNLKLVKVKETSIILSCIQPVASGKKGKYNLVREKDGFIIDRDLTPSEFAKKVKEYRNAATKRKIPFEQYLDELVKVNLFKRFKSIKNKFPNEKLPKDGFITNYTMTSKGIFRSINGNIISSNTFNFVITKSGELKIGFRHHLLGDKAEVLAAGSIRFKNGKITELDNLSGHYKPTLEESLDLKSIFEATGIPIKRAKYSIWGFKEVGNGYIELDKIIKTIFIDKLNTI